MAFVFYEACSPLPMGEGPGVRSGFGDVYLSVFACFFVGFEECFGVAWVLVRAGVRQIQRGWFGIWIRCKIKRHMRFV